jgi:peptide/nickel transport system permease protein
MGRGKYLLRRLVLIVPTLFGLSLLTFTVSHIVPADPAALAAGPRASKETVEQYREKFGLNDPIYEQYWVYVKGLLHGDLGTSIISRHPVTDDLRDRFPATLELALAAMLIAITLGVPLGILAAVRQNGWLDQAARIFAISSVSIPGFWFALLLQLTFASSLHWLPLSKQFPTLSKPPDDVTGLLTVDCLLAGDFGAFWVAVKHLILPAAVLSIGSMAIIMRTLRGDMLEVLGQDFVRTARAKGLGERRVILRHAVRNAFIPSLTMIGLSFGWALGGTVLVETVFDWPGIGSYAVQAATNLDFEPIMGVTILVGIIFIALNLIVDLLYGVLDPRIRY